MHALKVLLQHERNSSRSSSSNSGSSRLVAAALEDIVWPAVEQQLEAAVASSAAGAADPVAAAAAVAAERLGAALLPSENYLVGLLQGVSRLLHLNPDACIPEKRPLLQKLLQQLLQHTFAVAALEGCYSSSVACCGSSSTSSSGNTPAAVRFLHSAAPEGIAASSNILVGFRGSVVLGF